MSDKKKKIIITTVVILVVVLLLAVLFWKILEVSSNIGNQAPIDENPDLDVVGEQGQLDSDTEKIEAELKKRMDESMVAVSINSRPYFETPESEGSLQIENMSINNTPVKVEIYDNNTGDKIYDTKGVLEPASYIKTAKLDVKLAEGTYDCTAYFIKIAGGQEVGKAAVGLNLTIGGKN